MKLSATDIKINVVSFKFQRAGVKIKQLGSEILKIRIKLKFKK